MLLDNPVEGAGEMWKASGMKTVIVAAGQGFRLRERTERIPKTLLPFREGTVLTYILDSFAAVGVREFVIVVGYRPDLIPDYLESHGFFGHSVSFVENVDWRRGNGVSVACAGQALAPGEEVFLSMSDHLVPAPALKKIQSAESAKNLLLTDPRVDKIFDIDDATKVDVTGGRIAHIGKSLTEYNAVDCGIFRVNGRFFRALENQIERGNESISDGVRMLIDEGDFESVSIPDECHWIDIDTPAAYGYALENQDRYPDSKSRRVQMTLSPDPLV